MMLKVRFIYIKFVMMAMVVLAEGQFAFGAKLTYEDYASLSKEDKGRVVRKYAEKNGQGYWEVGAYKYRVRTMISAECALETALLMDKFYDEVSDTFGSRFHDAVQTNLYLFTDQESYTTFLAFRHVDVGFSAGMYIPEEHILAVCGGVNERERREILFHEATHQILHAYTVKNNIPVWFNEGMATNFQTWDVTKSNAENLRSAVAQSSRRYLVVTAVRAGEMYSLKKLLSISLDEWNSTKEPGLNYAMAWSFTNFMLSTPEKSAMMNQILEAIRKGTNLDKILSPGMVKKLEEEWHEDQKTRMMLYEEFIVPAMRLMMEKQGELGLKLLEQGVNAYPRLSDARFYRGKYYLSVEDYDKALKEFEAIEEIDPQFPDLYVLMVRVCMENGDLPKAKAYVQKLIRQDRRNRVGKDLMREISKQIRIQQMKKKREES